MEHELLFLIASHADDYTLCSVMNTCTILKSRLQQERLMRRCKASYWSVSNAIYLSYLDVIKHLYKTGSKITPEDAKIAATLGILEIIEWINTTCPTVLTQDVLLCAFYHGNLHLIRYLYEIAHLNYDSSHLINEMISRGHLPVLVYLQQKYQLVLKPSVLPLAVRHGKLCIIRWLVEEYGISGKCNASTIMYARKKKYYAVVDYMRRNNLIGN